MKKSGIRSTQTCGLREKKLRRTEDEKKPQGEENRHSPHREQSGLTLLLGRGKNKDSRAVRWGGEEVRGEEER